MYTYRQILTQIFRIIRQNPSLWIFGLFAALLGNNNGLEIMVGSFGFSGQGIFSSFINGLIDGGLFTFGGIKGIAKIMVSNPLLLFILAIISLCLIALTVLVIWITLVSLAALIVKAVSFSKSKTLSARQAFGAGMAKFWPVLGLNFFIRVVCWLIVLAIVALAGLPRFPGLIYLFILGFDVLLAATIIFSLVTNYAICAAVLRNLGLKASLEFALGLFRQNWLVSLEVAVFLFFINLIVNSLLWFFLSWALLHTLSLFGDFPLAYLVIIVLLFILFIAVQIALTIIYWCFWALIFEILSGKKSAVKSWLLTVFRSR